MADRVPRGNDLRVQLDEQLDFLRTHGTAYDEGKEHYAKLLAAVVMTLVENPQGGSLLEQIGVQDKLGFIDAGPQELPPGAIEMFPMGLHVLEWTLDATGGRMRYVPASDRVDEGRSHPPTSFADWWEATVLRDKRGGDFSRRSLVRDVRNTDGGGHLDKSLRRSYYELTRDNSLELTVGDATNARPPDNSPALASIRHIAWELEQTIVRGLRWAGDDAVVPVQVCALRLTEAGDLDPSEPCPCGSGRPVRHCFDQRRPRLNVREVGPKLATPRHETAPPGPDVIYLDGIWGEPVLRRHGP